MNHFRRRPHLTHAPEQKSRPMFADRIIVLVGLMGAGKTTIGRRLASKLHLPFVDADHEIERAAGCSIAEFFERHGEPAFREGERRVIQRLLSGPPVVLATGGGAYLDPSTRQLIRAHGCSVWLRCSLSTLERRLSGRHGRPLLAGDDWLAKLAKLHEERHPIYTQADIIVDCQDENVDVGTRRVIQALRHHNEPKRVRVGLGQQAYDVMVGRDLVARADHYLLPFLGQKRVIIITDETVGRLHLPRLEHVFKSSGIAVTTLTIPPGEGSKSLHEFGRLANAILEEGIDRNTALIGFGGGVVGDLTGFLASTLLRGIKFFQIPTTLLAQVDSSVGGKTGVNVRAGKNLVGTFYQPQLVLADPTFLDTLPHRERAAGYAEIVKSGMIAGEDFFSWCELNGAHVLAGDMHATTEGVRRACAFKAGVVKRDAREEASTNGRALLNFGHTFGHALEAHFAYDGTLLHGEAVSIGLYLATALSAHLGYCSKELLVRLGSHLHALAMPANLAHFAEKFRVDPLIDAMTRDKKMRSGVLNLVLIRNIGDVFTTSDVSLACVKNFLIEQGCAA